MRIVLLLFALPLAAQIHIEACSPTDAGYTLPSTCYTSPIVLPAGSPAYFQKERYGTFSYHFAVPDGQYSVVLHFIENSTAVSASGQRVFSVGINGAPVIVGLDLFATAGFNAGVDKSFSATASGGAGITIAFTTVTRNAVISAIDITPVPVAPSPVYFRDVATNRPASCANGLTFFAATDSPDLWYCVSAAQGWIKLTATAAFVGPLVQMGGLAIAGAAVPVGTISQLLAGIPFETGIFQLSVKVPSPCPDALSGIASAQGATCYQGVWVPYDYGHNLH